MDKVLQSKNRVAEWYKNKTYIYIYIYILYNRSKDTEIDLNTIRSKDTESERMKKVYFMHMELKIKSGQQYLHQTKQTLKPGV